MVQMNHFYVLNDNISLWVFSYLLSFFELKLNLIRLNINLIQFFYILISGCYELPFLSKNIVKALNFV